MVKICISSQKGINDGYMKKTFFPKTDLALETHEFNQEKGIDDGIKIDNFVMDGIEVTRAEIFSGKGEKISGKKAGVYITADIGEIHTQTKKDQEKTSKVIAELIKTVMPKKKGSVLVAGIGNEEIVSDAIGPKTVSGVIPTRHIKRYNEKLYNSFSFSEVVAVQTGVMGTTGLESAEMISALVDKIKPTFVLAVDSLASRRLSRLATTVQISNSGISPGSGVANRRLELNEDVLGIPVVAVGIPTVVDAYTLVSDITGEEKYKELYGEKNNFYVAPKETDKIIKEASHLLSVAINMALHELEFHEILELQ